MGELEGKVAIVTGAGQGMGKAIALELAQAGSRLALAGIREDTIAQVKNEVLATGCEVLVVRMDVSKWEDVEKTVRTTAERFGRIDILVNNAGISPKGKGGTPLEVMDIEGEVWDSVMDVNLKGVFNCSKAVMPYLMKRRSTFHGDCAAGEFIAELVPQLREIDIRAVPRLGGTRRVQRLRVNYLRREESPFAFTMLEIYTQVCEAERMPILR